MSGHAAVTDHRPGRVRRLQRAAAYPVLRLVEPRFADLARRMHDARQALHDESEQTRRVLAAGVAATGAEVVATREVLTASLASTDAELAVTRAEVAAAREALSVYATTNDEQLTFVAQQLRELADEVHTLRPAATAMPQLDAAALERSLALMVIDRVGLPARALVVGGAPYPLAGALGALGADVTTAEAVPPSPPSGAFDVAIRLPGGPGGATPGDGDALRGLVELLRPGGLAIVSAAASLALVVTTVG